MKKICLLLVIGLCVIISGCVSQTQEGQPTQPNDRQEAVPPQESASGQQAQNRQMRLPSEMTNACVGKSEGDVCEFRINGNNINGTCRIGRSVEPTCFPSMGQRQMSQNRTSFMKDTVDACVGKSEGDDCEFKVGEDNINGICRSRQTGELMCFSANMSARPVGRIGLEEGFPAGA